MSAKAIRKSYYTTTALASIVGRLGEFSVDITKNTLVVFDGTTVGGIPLALANHTHSNASPSVAGFMAAVDYTYLYNHTHTIATSSTNGFMSATDKVKLDSMNGGGGTPIPYTPNASAITIASRDANGDTSFHFANATKFVGPLNGNADTVTNGVYTSGTYSNPSWLTGLAGSKVTHIHDASIDDLAWSKLTGSKPNVSGFPNDANYVNTAGSITGTAAGVLSAGGRETNSATAQTVVLRDSSGRAQMVDPVANQDIATKGWVLNNMGTIKTIQQGSAITSGFGVTIDATISAVNPAKTFVIFNGIRCGGGVATGSVILTDATTVTCSMSGSSGTIYFTVVEYN